MWQSKCCRRTIDRLTSPPRCVMDFSHGVTLVWVIDPSARTVTVNRPATPPEILTGDSILDGGNVLAGFEIPAGRLFSEM